MSDFRKEFTVAVPDEPFKETTELGKNVQCTYIGPRYIVVEVHPYTGLCQSPVGFFETHEAINLNRYYKGNECKIILIDAEINPLEAAYITHQYTNEDVEDYVFYHNDEEIWRFEYEKETGILSDIFKCPHQLFYDFQNEKFLTIPYEVHGITNEEFWEGINNQIKDYESRNLTSPECKDYLESLKGLKDIYKDIDHWKIPFAEQDPFNFDQPEE